MAAPPNAWAERFGLCLEDGSAAPGPGVWHRDREHGRCPRDQLSEHIGSEAHTDTKILKQRFGDGDVRGWGRWTPPDHVAWPKTSAASTGGGGKREKVGNIGWSQGTYPQPPVQPPLNISPSTALEQLLPVLSSVTSDRTIFSEKPWRLELKEWDERQKPAAVAIHRELQAVDLPSLSDAALWTHAERAMANSHFAGALHGHFGNAFGAPLNVFMAQMATWLDAAGHLCGPAEARVLVDCMAGSSLPSVIANNPESLEAAEAITASPDATAILNGADDDAAIIARLRGSIEAVEAWAQHVGYRLIDGHTGFATPPVLQEVPRLFLALLRHCVATAPGVHYAQNYSSRFLFLKMLT
jgi:hypothetical protein